MDRYRVDELARMLDCALASDEAVELLKSSSSWYYIGDWGEEMIALGMPESDTCLLECCEDEDPALREFVTDLRARVAWAKLARVTEWLTSVATPPTQVGDGVGEVIAVRAWNAHDVYNGLMSVTARCTWHETMVAECRKNHCQRSPGTRCMCGIAAAASVEVLEEFLMRTPWHPQVAMGVVGLSGRIVVGTRGYRAERGRMRLVILPFDDEHKIGRVQAMYPNVPVMGLAAGYRAAKSGVSPLDIMR